MVVTRDLLDQYLSKEGISKLPNDWLSSTVLPKVVDIDRRKGYGNKVSGRGYTETTYARVIPTEISS